MADPYLYADTDILRNKLDIRDGEELKAFERAQSASRLETLPWSLPITPAGYREIHRFILQDVYEWAGHDRTVRMWRTGMEFARPQFIASALTSCFAAINAENNLRGLDASAFAGRAAVHCGDLNTLHPFREGNGRTLRAFLERLGHQAGHVVDLERIEPAFWNHASRMSHEAGRDDLLAAAIAGAIIEAPEQAREIEPPELGDDYEL